VSHVDDTATLRKMLVSAKPGATVKLAPADYWIAIDATGAGLEIPSGVTLNATGSTIYLVENSRSAYDMIRLASGASIVGGVIVGDLERHTGTKGEWGMCLSVRGVSDVAIRQTKVSGCWGDGIYVGAAGVKPSTRVLIESVEASGNRRNNISIVAADGFIVRDTFVHDAKGTRPEAGIDLEPNPGNFVRNGEISNVRSERNGHLGLVMSGFAGPVSEIRVTDTDIRETDGPGIWLKQTGGVVMQRVTTESNRGQGIVLERPLQSPQFKDFVSRKNGMPDRR
jgi:hypothetical protein